MRRCFLCAADMLGPSERSLAYPGGRVRAFPIACGSCGLLLEAGADPACCRAHLAAHLSGPTVLPDPDAPYGLDLYTLRSAATAFGLGLRPHDAEGRAALRRPHDRHAARADLYALDGTAGPPVSLGLLCRPDGLEAALAMLAVHAAWTDDVVILLDAPVHRPETVPAAGFPRGAVRVGARPLGQDFAAQRNALQDLAGHPWMLQLDADEILSVEAGRLLPALAALAEAGDVVSVGLARRNCVDGLLSDVYPDVQYRLNRRCVRYAGRVHERPVLDGGWPRSLIALHGAIEHHLDRAHVLARSARYERLAPGHGRLEEAVALLRSYRD
ncbi:hypothetical protein MKK58_00775 [Methylobacterium sp. J-078]|uniref:hypothetical protein n=1 Tax=Methylobacterium sp. J-078 TaxID=2836657 RepID=UPI001FB9A848|nr:hypothetical protein [Methylobacterium sp. J-078]MCJ2043089.1 hypothetical protein [Methylobacterium sp. J-078]